MSSLSELINAPFCKQYGSTTSSASLTSAVSMSRSLEWSVASSKILKASRTRTASRLPVPFVSDEVLDEPNQRFRVVLHNVNPPRRLKLDVNSFTKGLGGGVEKDGFRYSYSHAPATVKVIECDGVKQVALVVMRMDIGDF